MQYVKLIGDAVGSKFPFFPLVNRLDINNNTAEFSTQENVTIFLNCYAY